MSPAGFENDSNDDDNNIYFILFRVIGTNNYYGIPLEVTAEAVVMALLLVAEGACQSRRGLHLVRFVLPDADAAHVLA